MNNHIDYQRKHYLVLNPEGEQVWASNFKHLAESQAWLYNRTRPGHTVVEREGNEPITEAN